MKKNNTPSTDKLPDISQVAPLSAMDSTCIEELREVLKRHGALKRFGICLLHSHFPLSEGEFLVETCDADLRILTLRPERIAKEPKGALIETSWRLDTGAAASMCIQLCKTYEKDGSHTSYHKKT